MRPSRNPSSSALRPATTPCGKTSNATLVEEPGLPEVPNGPKPILKLAGQNELFASSGEQWLNYADARISTAHDYSGEKAGETLMIVGDFVDDTISLYQTMSGRTWE